MADENLKDFSVNWILFGLLFFSLLTYSISFMFYNNPLGFGDSESMFSDSSDSINSELISVSNSSNSLLNISAETNPENSFLGSRDSVATSYGVAGTGKGFFESSKIFMGWVLTGTTGEILIAVFSGIIGFLSLYFITKWIRAGF